ncbi:MAG: globin domain-containing protein [Roseobacter sp.]
MLTQTDISRLRQSALIMRESKEASAATFYAKLFDRAPELREMFPDQMVDQERKFAAALVVVVSSIVNLGTLRPVVEALARRHVSYGVTVDHFQTVEAALLATLEEQGATKEELALWRKIYRFLADHMIATAYPG